MPILLHRRGLLAVALGAPAIARAEGFPSRPVRIVVPAPPGQSTDLAARVVAEWLSRRWPQRVVVENRAGGVGVPGTEAVTRAAPDGHTLGIGSPSTLAVNPHVLPGLSYDVARDVAPVIHLSSQPLLVVVHPSFPARSMGELVAHLRAHPGENYGSPGPATTPHMAAELLAHRLGLRITHVPYRGTAPAMVDLLAGNIRLMFDSATGSIPHVQAGRIRALGVTSAERMAQLPDAPTVAETVSPGFEALAWAGVFAPAATPEPILRFLNTEMALALADPEVRRRYAEVGAFAVGGSAAAFGAFIRAEGEKWGEVARVANVRLEA
jgi:tripartite-type tricarboxylate transporter receptor subunit TctC